MMIKTIKIGIIIILPYLIVINAHFFFGCNGTNGQDGISSDINESKKRQVYICEYESLQNPYVINDSLKIHVKSAWLEKSWKYSGNETVVTNNFQLIVVTDPKDIEGIRITWTIGIDSDRYFFGSGNESIVNEFKTLPNAELEIWKVQQGHYLNKGEDHKIIGEFRLNKK